IAYQSITRIDKAIADGDFAKNDVLLNTFNYVKENDSALHIFCLLSDDGVHSHQRQLNAIIHHAKSNGIEQINRQACTDRSDVHAHQRQLNAIIQDEKSNGIERIYIHAFTDGRDVAPDSGADSIKKLQEFLAAEGVGEIATVSGRFYAMDRDNRWPRIKKAYDAIYHGEGNHAEDPVEAVKNSYKEEVFDEFIIPTVI